MPTANKPPIFDRPETILGVCEALGDDFGISGHWFRAALFPLVLVFPWQTVAAYFGLALLVLVSRIAFPDRRKVIATRLPETQPSDPAEEAMRLAA